MESDKSVFCSSVSRNDFKGENNLCDLLDITPVKPIQIKNIEDDVLLRNFEPVSDKYYVPKTKSRLKVRTVREIRKQFEQDNYSFIIEEMEKQQNTLLAKIKTGSAKDNNTKMMAKKLLGADHPITRTAWQMLNNINPEKQIHPTQFVLWDGKRIRVTGSRGGKNRFICNYDLGKQNVECQRNRLERQEKPKKRSAKGLLRNSLNIKFKPGPLCKKIYLDDSHLKYQMGPIELVKLPKPGLEIRTSCGTPLEPVICSFLNNLRASDGTITQQWAEFAVSVVGIVENNSIVDEKQALVSFDLSYNCGQNSILMRQDIAPPSYEHDTNSIYEPIDGQSQSDNTIEVKKVIDNILDCVEISMKEDSMFSVEDELPSTISEQPKGPNINDLKEKNKRKYCELGRLDVSIITLPGTTKKQHLNQCEKSYCSLGCICDSLECTYKFKQHCGHFDCMLGCRCEFSKYRDIELFENCNSELIPGLMRLDNKINNNLAKEEQKFHQTVVVSGEKSILLKSTKRNLKSSKKYAEFYSKMRLKPTKNPRKILAVLDKKLNCKAIEPWCMVHNLYKCFCKGRFIEAYVAKVATPPTITDHEVNSSGGEDTVDKNKETRNLRPQRICQKTVRNPSDRKTSFSNLETEDHYRCARTTQYEGRKYKDDYYKITNSKILEMEKNDKTLHSKMMRRIKKIQITTNVTKTLKTSEKYVNVCDVKLDQEIARKNVDMQKVNKTNVEPYPKPFGEVQLVASNKSKGPKTNDIVDSINGDFDEATRTKIIANAFPKSMEILRESYLKGKKITLEGPTKGKVIIHSWEFVLSRFNSQRNIFMVTKNMRHRIFIAVDDKHPFFENCININTIHNTDLYKYPFVVRYLITSAPAKDHFCILLGWDFCWEIIASGKKNGVDRNAIIDTDATNTEDVANSAGNDDNLDTKLDDEITINNSSGINLYDDDKIGTDTNKSERSKWFLMAIENEFTEIHCHKAGFYVKREQILEAIKLARATGKTVVVNKAKEGTEFGFYAMSYSSQYCIIVGPYAMDASLGFEAIVNTRSSKTVKNIKGHWLTTNKVDNEKVLIDPQSFMSSEDLQNSPNQIETVESKNNINIGSDIQPSTHQNESIVDISKDHAKKPVKMVKPIKIHRTNGFYHLNPEKKVVSNISTAATGKSYVKVKRFPYNKNETLILKSNNINDHILNTAEENTNNTTRNDQETNTDVAQIKITSVYSESTLVQENERNEQKKHGMFILKPEEINKRLPVFYYQSNDFENEHDETTIDMDIKNFLFPKAGKSNAEDDVLFISDDEECDIHTQSWEEAVSIKCSNICNLGWIRGTRCNENRLTIDMDGFTHIQRYEQEDAFKEINWVLSSKISVPEHITLEWQVIPLSDESELGPELNILALTKNHVITENGIKKLSKVIKKSRKENWIKNSHPTKADSNLLDDANVMTSDMMHELEETSRILDDEGAKLWNKTENRSSEIMDSLIIPEECKPEMTTFLLGMRTENDNLLNE